MMVIMIPGRSLTQMVTGGSSVLSWQSSNGVPFQSSQWN